MDTSFKSPKLKLGFVSYDAAKHACLNWHYSKAVPVGKLVKIGVWENDRFIGVILFAYGANNNMAKAYGLNFTECVELVRIALTSHVHPVSKILSIALRLLKQQSPGLKLIVSYADPEQGHHGGIYQATNWIYAGMTKSQVVRFYKNKWSHMRSINSTNISKEAKKNLPKRKTLPKHIYLYPLNKGMYAKISKIKQAYPKRTRAKQAMAEHHSAQRGSVTHQPAPSIEKDGSAKNA